MRAAAVTLMLVIGASSAPVRAQGAPPDAPSAVPSAVQPGVLRIAGHFGVEGRNPDGTAYLGTAFVQPRSDGQVDIVWQVGQLHHGVGKLDGNIVTVDIGDVFPAIYEIQSDGSLNGTWGGGSALERMVPLGLLDS